MHVAASYKRKGAATPTGEFQRKLVVKIMGELGRPEALRHVEAYIRLEAATCEKMLRQGRDTCFWFDQHREYQGVVYLKNISEFQTVISYSSCCSQASGDCSGDAVLGVCRASVADHYNRPYFSCSLCSKRTAQLILAHGEWACRKCLGLGFRSQRLTRDQRMQERLNELTQLLRPFREMPTRPRYMRANQFAELSEEYLTLREALKDAPLQVAQTDLGFVLAPQWPAPSDKQVT